VLEPSLSTLYLCLIATHILFYFGSTTCSTTIHPDELSSLDALREALNNLENLVDTVGDAYDQSLASGKYRMFEERP
jgi:hypothetical protein